MNKEYLGDSVYADFDGYYIILYLNNGDGPFSTIMLEPQVFQSLLEYKDKINKEIGHGNS